MIEEGFGLEERTGLVGREVVVVGAGREMQCDE